MKNAVEVVEALTRELDAKTGIIEAIKALLAGKKSGKKRGRKPGSKNKKKVVAKQLPAKTIKVKSEAGKNGADQGITA